jgi:hypothetical protein
MFRINLFLFLIIILFSFSIILFVRAILIVGFKVLREKEKVINIET